MKIEEFLQKPKNARAVSFRANYLSFFHGKRPGKIFILAWKTWKSQGFFFPKLAGNPDSHTRHVMSYVHKETNGTYVVSKLSQNCGSQSQNRESFNSM